MKLSGREYKQLQDALLSAFPTRATLAQMLFFELGESLDTIVSSDNLAGSVFDLIRWAVAQGRLHELIAGAQNSNPNNTELRAFVEQVWQARVAAENQTVVTKTVTPPEKPQPPLREHLQALLAIQQGNLRKLERQEALYGGISVPLMLMNQLDEVRGEIAKLEAQLNARHSQEQPDESRQPTVRRHDPFSSYETAMDDLLRRLGTQHVRYDEALACQQRLRENIDTSRRYGDTETSRAGRAQVVGQLNSLAQDALGVSFNQLM